HCSAEIGAIRATIHIVRLISGLGTRSSGTLLAVVTPATKGGTLMLQQHIIGTKSASPIGSARLATV
ncbi:MAG: hypothetical protein Q7V62_06885, partial [Actinomycetota bacterium]|nr:hypothetical protein [Actinomycetota bacterium]